MRAFKGFLLSLDKYFSMFSKLVLNLNIFGIGMLDKVSLACYNAVITAIDPPINAQGFQVLMSHQVCWFSCSLQFFLVLIL